MDFDKAPFSSSQAQSRVVQASRWSDRSSPTLSWRRRRRRKEGINKAKGQIEEVRVGGERKADVPGARTQQDVQEEKSRWRWGCCERGRYRRVWKGLHGETEWWFSKIKLKKYIKGRKACWIMIMRTTKNKQSNILVWEYSCKFIENSWCVLTIIAGRIDNQKSTSIRISKLSP